MAPLPLGEKGVSTWRCHAAASPPRDTADSSPPPLEGEGQGGWGIQPGTGIIEKNLPLRVSPLPPLPAGERGYRPGNRLPLPFQGRGKGGGMTHATNLSMSINGTVKLVSVKPCLM